MLNPNAATPPPLPTGRLFYIAVGSQQLPNQNVAQIEALVNQGQINGNTLVWTAGMAGWLPLSSVPELMHLVNIQTPPPIPNNQ
jgi:hypothetical protein